MRWESGRRSDNVEDRRGFGGRPMVIGGGMGIGGIVILLLLMCAGVDPRVLLQQGGGPGPGQGGPPMPGQPDRVRAGRINPDHEPLVEFTRVVLASTEDVWREQFRRTGRTYQEPKLVLFTGETESACGYASAAVGPFYCPADEDVYLDLQFFQEMQQRFRAPGDTAQAYVIAHEVGHHVQNLLGTLPKVQAAQQAAGSKAAANRLQVRVELQADCYAGIWANRSNARRSFIGPGDVDAALQTASAIGDDTLQRQAQGRVVPDAFTHGSAEQRKRWFLTGFQQGKLQACDTFAAGSP